MPCVVVMVLLHVGLLCLRLCLRLCLCLRLRLVLGRHLAAHLGEVATAVVVARDAGVAEACSPLADGMAQRMLFRRRVGADGVDAGRRLRRCAAVALHGVGADVMTATVAVDGAVPAEAVARRHGRQRMAGRMR